MFDTLQSVHWDVPELESMKSQIKKNHDEMCELYNTLKSQRDSLSSAWRGDAGDIADIRLEQKLRKLEAVIKEMASQMEILEYACGRYRQCEENVLSRIRSIGG